MAKADMAENPGREMYKQKEEQKQAERGLASIKAMRWVMTSSWWFKLDSVSFWQSARLVRMRLTSPIAMALLANSDGLCTVGGQ